MECRLDDLTVYYEVHGEGRPLLTLHGFTPDHRIMKGCLEPVFAQRPGWQRIYFDLPGMGRTKGPDWLTTSDQMLDVVMAFIEAVLPERSFALAGQSYGAYLARGVLRRLPERVDGLALIAPLVLPLHKNRTVPTHQVLVEDPDLIAGLPEEGRAAFVDFAVVQTRRVYERTRDEVGVGVDAADVQFLERLLQHGYPFSEDVDADQPPYERPALFLMGRQDATVGYRDAWRLIEQFPRATFAVLDRAGHNLQIEQEGLLNCLVGEWLDRLE